MKKLFSVLVLAAAMTLVMGFAAQAGKVTSIELGKPMEDFSVETYDGNVFTLSEALESYDMVLINLWGIFCFPCEMEMPCMQEAYEQYKDRVGMIALSIDPSDTPDKLKEYADEHGLTFPIGSDTETGLFKASKADAVPTSIVVDRFGNVAMISIGSEPKTSRFTTLFDYFLSDDYTETVQLTAFPGERPGKGLSDEELTALVNAQGSDLLFENPKDKETFPVIAQKQDDRDAVTFSNTGKENSSGAMKTTVEASEGDALVFSYKSQLDNVQGIINTLMGRTEIFDFEMLKVHVDEDCVYQVYDSSDWKEAVIPLSEGTHQVVFEYVVGSRPYEGNQVWVADVYVAEGEEAQELIRQLPEQPVSDAFTAEVKPEGVEEAVIEVKSSGNTYNKPVYITEQDSAVIHITLSEEEDPGNVIIYAFGSGDDHIAKSLLSLAEVGEDGYDITIPIEDDSYMLVYVIPGFTSDDLNRSIILNLVRGDKGKDKIIKYYGIYGGARFVEAE